MSDLSSTRQHLKYSEVVLTSPLPFPFQSKPSVFFFQLFPTSKISQQSIYLNLNISQIPILCSLLWTEKKIECTKVTIPITTGFDPAGQTRVEVTGLERACDLG